MRAIKKSLNIIRKRLSGCKGFSLTELLACTLIMLLGTSVLASTITLAAKNYDTQVSISKADILCESLSYALREKMSYVYKFKPDASGNVYYSTSSDLGYYPFKIQTTSAGELYLQYTVPAGQGNGKYFLINSKSYFDGKFVAKYKIKTVPETVTPDTPLNHFVVTIGIYDKKYLGDAIPDGDSDPNALSFVRFIVYPVTSVVTTMQ